MKSSTHLASIEPLEARIAPAAIVDLAGVRVYRDIAVPGDHVAFAIDIANSGDMKSSGFRGIHLYLSTDAILDGLDIPLGDISDVPVTLKPGKVKTVSGSFTLPELKLPTPEFPAGSGYVIAELRNQGVPEQTAASNSFLHVFKFGTVGLRKNVVLRGEDGDGTGFSFGLSGPGTGTLALAGGIVDLSFTGTDAKSHALAGSHKSKTGDAFVTVRSITGGSLNSVLMPGVNVSTNVTFSGGIETLILHDVGTPGSDHMIELGSSLSKRVSLHRVTDMDLHSGGSISLLGVADWTNFDGNQDTITVAQVFQLTSMGDRSLGIPGNFQASLNLSDTGFSLFSGKISGALSGVIWTASGNIKELKAEDVDHSQFTAVNMGKLWVTGNVRHATSGNILQTKIAISGTDTDQSSIGAPDVRAAGRLQDFEIKAPNASIDRIEADDWHGGQVLAKSLHKLDLSGDLRTPVRGDLVGVGIGLTGSGDHTETFDVNGFVSDSTIMTSQPSSFDFGAMYRSKITAIADIKSFEIEGRKGHPDEAWFSESNVDAQFNSIGKVVLRNVNGDPFLPAFGITANRVLSYTRRIELIIPPVVTNLVKLDTPIGNIDPYGSYFLKIT